MPLSTLSWGEKNAGGVDSVSQILVRQLCAQKRPFRYRILAFDPLNQCNYTGQVTKLSQNVEVVVCPLRETRLGLPLPSLLSAWLRIQEQLSVYKPDLVHSHFNSWMFALCRKTRNILTLHSYRKIARKPVSKFNDFVYERIIPWMSDFSVDTYTCVGNDLYQALYRDTGKPIKIIGNPVDPEYFSGGLPLKCKHHIGINLVTCALITRRKRIEGAIALLIELKRRRCSVTLRIIGPNMDDQYYQQLQMMVKQNNLEREVIFLGELSKKEIIEQYQFADIGVFTSSQETFGLAPLEMIAVGLPLISTPVGILNERQDVFAKHGVAFMCEGEEAMIADRIDEIKMLDTRTLQAYLRDQFAVENVIEHYQNLYREVLR